MERRLKGRGWILEFLGGLAHPRDDALMRELDMDYILCHIGMFLAKDGVDRGFSRDDRALRARRCWLKLTAPYRFATAPEFDGAAILVQTLVTKCLIASSGARTTLICRCADQVGNISSSICWASDSRRGSATQGSGR